jgi:hypothetical protein
MILAVLFISSCMRSQSKDVTSSEFIPPTLVATAIKTATTDPFRPTEDPRGPCEDNLDFVEDVTVPDGTVFQPGEEIVKKWKVKNSGTCEWISRYSIRMLSGNSMGAETKQKLKLLKPVKMAKLRLLSSLRMNREVITANGRHTMRRGNRSGKISLLTFLLPMKKQMSKSSAEDCVFHWMNRLGSTPAIPNID